MLGGRSGADMLIERDKVADPFRRDRNSPAAIVHEGLGLWSKAALLHRVPCFVFWSAIARVAAPRPMAGPHNQLKSDHVMFRNARFAPHRATDSSVRRQLQGDGGWQTTPRTASGRGALIRICSRQS